MSKNIAIVVNWADIDTIVLDMDGTILDLSYDHYFWHEHIHQAYASKHQLPLADVKVALLEKLHAKTGTLDWYCTDYWSQELDLNIAELKREIKHRIAILDGAETFLQWAAANKRLLLATNAHRDSVAVKMQQTGIDKYFATVVSSHDYGYPKEQQHFWRRFQQEQAINPARSLFVDDNPSVLQAAKQFGISQVVAISKPNTAAPASPVEHFYNVERLSDLL